MNIVFITNCKFPFGSASSIRTLNLAHLLNSVGHNVHIIADFTSSEIEEFDFCDYETLLEFTTSHLRRMSLPSKCVKALEQYCYTHRVDAVFTNACSDRFFKIAKYCQKSNLKLFVESCEWYDYSNYKLGRLDYRYWINEKMISKGFSYADGIISISRFLDEHNRSLGVKSVRIPTIMDIDNTSYSVDKCQNEKITIIYTGNPGKSKEYLSPIIACLAHNQKYREKICFHIYGPSMDQVRYNLGDDYKYISLAEDSVVVHGSVPQKEMNEIMCSADYSMFIRPDRVSSHAGFPTKLGESFAAGTPVISNLTGDIGIYLKDRVNGFIVDGISENSVEEIFNRLISISNDEYLRMRKNARSSAEKAFNFMNYKSEIERIFI